jgi:hypothetical protein
MIKPYAYQFAPGSQTGGAIIFGVYRALLSLLGAHHWFIDSFTGTADSNMTSLTIRNVDMVATLTAALGTPNNRPVLLVQYDPGDGGAASPIINPYGGSDSTYALNTGTFMASTIRAVVIETEDSFTLALYGSGSTYENRWVWTCHLGRIFTPDNRSDDALGRGVHGILGGNFCNVSASATTARAIISPSLADPQTFIRENSNVWTPVFRSASYMYLSTTAVGQQRLDPAGDDSTQERLVPARMALSTGPAFAQTRFIKQRRYGIGTTDPQGNPVTLDVAYPSAVVDSPVAWLHQLGFTSNASTNLVHIFPKTGIINV